jgi:hypothetical protein
MEVDLGKKGVSRSRELNVECSSFKVHHVILSKEKTVSILVIALYQKAVRKTDTDNKTVRIINRPPVWAIAHCD